MLTSIGSGTVHIGAGGGGTADDEDDEADADAVLCSVSRIRSISFSSGWNSSWNVESVILYCVGFLFSMRTMLRTVKS